MNEYEDAATKAEASEPTAHWHASLDIQVGSTPMGTRLLGRRHRGPLRVQKPFFPEGPRCLHLYILHPPGGVVGGDQLNVHVEAAGGAHVLLTTPAAQKLYRSSGATSKISHTLSIAPGAILEWLPAETIVFDEARTHTSTLVQLGSSAEFIGWEMCSLGRPSAGSLFESGQYRSRLEIVVDGTPDLFESLSLDGGSDVLSAPWGLGGHSAFGTMVCVTTDSARLLRAEQALSELVGSIQNPRAGVTRLDYTLVLRCQSHRLQAIRGLMISAWKLARPIITGQPALEPRIWAT